MAIQDNGVGMLDWLKSVARGKPDKYLILRTGENADRKVVEDDLEEPPNPERWEIENQHRQPGTYRCQAVRNNEWAEAAWVVTIGDPQRAGEIDELREEIAALRRDRDGDGDGDFLDRVPEAALRGVLAGEISPAEAREIADLYAAFERGDVDQEGIADHVEDATDLKEIGGAALLRFLDDPEQIENLAEAGGRAAASAALGAAQQGQQAVAQQPQQPAQAGGGLDLEAGANGAKAATDGGEPEPPKSAAEKKLEEVRAEMDDGADDGGAEAEEADDLDEAEEAEEVEA